MRRARGRDVVLLYHRVLPARSAGPRDWPLSVSVEEFAAQMDLLVGAACVVPLQTIADAPAEDQRATRVAVTFDDGYADVVSHALPVLQQWSIPATVFLTTGFCDGSATAWWEDQRDRDPPRFLTPEQVQWAAGEGLAFENHTHRHPCLRRLPQAEAVREIEEAGDLIAQWTGRSPRLFAFPRGGWRDVSRRALRALSHAGYTAAFASATSSAPWYDRLGSRERPRVRVFSRQPVEWHTTLAEFRRWLAPRGGRCSRAN